MLVFRYDKTFEGLLTAVFDGYSRKAFPDKLIGENELSPMFTEEEHIVYTEKEKAHRVWAGVHRRVSKVAANMLMCVWLSEEEGSDNLIYRYIRKVFDNPQPFETNFSDDDVLQVKKIAMRVSKEKHNLVMFVRFQKAADDVYFAPVSPKCNALPLTIHHFKNRFAGQKWVIYDTKRHYGYFYDLKKVEEITLTDDDHLLSGKLDEELMAEDEKLFQDLWRDYFKAMTIKERINPRLQRQHMPRRFWKYLTEKQGE